MGTGFMSWEAYVTFPNDRTSHALSHEGRSKVPDKSYPGTTEEAFMPFADDSVGSCCSGRVVKSMIKEAWTASRMERPVLLTTHEVQGTGGFNCKVQSSICNIVMITETETEPLLQMIMMMFLLHWWHSLTKGDRPRTGRQDLWFSWLCISKHPMEFQ